MPGEVIDQANPPPLPSLLSSDSDLLKLAVTLSISDGLTDAQLTAVKKWRRAANYIAAAMIFLKDNTLLEREIKPEDIKHRLLGHWGTCPGLVLAYAHLNILASANNLDMIFVVGPGHGAPGILSSLWLEGSLGKFYPKYTRDKKGLANLISGFSTPGGFPSHINAETPGAIHEGGELGYALSVAFGAIMDNPNLVVACVVGDGEAESGPTATAWHAYKYIDPAESGAVIPIVHVNGFKISERTIYGCMDDIEISCLFTGYGYQVRFVEDLDNIDQDLQSSLKWALAEIHKIQKAARVDKKPITKPRWPVLIMRTPKGWGGPKELDGEFIEGSFHAHQVPLPAAKTDKSQLAMLNEWLSSYEIGELLPDGLPTPEIISVMPKEDAKKLGQFKSSYDAYEPLDVPDWKPLATSKPGEMASCMKQIGIFLDQVMQANPNSFRIFSPDELVSNKLDAVFEHTGRNFQWDQYSRGKGGRVIEILSEHTCQGFMQGYTLTGRTALFPSYESFLGIVDTMMVQYSKFNKMSREVTWRTDISSINYLETSTWARQEHNGFSHQNPSFIGSVLNLKPSVARVYLPPDANCFLSTMAHCLRSKNYVNLMVGSKQPTPVFLTPDEADRHCRAGASVWHFASCQGEPDFVLVGVGTEVTFEVVAAAALLRKVAPDLKVRVVNVTDVMILSPEGQHPHALNDSDFDSLFTKDRGVHFNYHGYPVELKGLLFGRPGLDRVTVAGYMEEGSTTTPFDMMLRNKVSRYQCAIEAIRGGGRWNEKVREDQHEIVAQLEHEVQKITEEIYATGKDPEGTYDTPKFE